jgi:hypothetical protein
MNGVIQHICEDIRDTKNEAVQVVIPAVVDGMDWIHQAAENLADLGKIEYDKLKAFQKVVIKLTEAMETGNLSIVQSLFEQDLTAALQNLKIQLDMEH